MQGEIKIDEIRKKPDIALVNAVMYDKAECQGWEHSGDRISDLIIGQTDKPKYGLDKHSKARYKKNKLTDSSKIDGRQYPSMRCNGC